MAQRQQEKKSRLETPGTMVIVFIFLAWFLLLYIVGWVALSGVWPVR